MGQAPNFRRRRAGSRGGGGGGRIGGFAFEVLAGFEFCFFATRHPPRLGLRVYNVQGRGSGVCDATCYNGLPRHYVLTTATAGLIIRPTEP